MCPTKHDFVPAFTQVHCRAIVTHHVAKPLGEIIVGSPKGKAYLYWFDWKFLWVNRAVSIKYIINWIIKVSGNIKNCCIARRHCCCYSENKRGPLITVLCGYFVRFVRASFWSASWPVRVLIQVYNVSIRC